ncbi:transglycosylase SLT domain-containing protein [Falsirhodobacter sp. alg1]|uniref:transglycosylase SLT domain-containing protein n=1 Tax=Falsirhodobacter sp. alg1 TaxID=1472418 RepID=UPI000788B75F|nr:transglycosylase SLT domain-containing protein [Falsirhodobacter sp. alg1]
MSRFLRASILLVLLASCGSTNFSAPGNLDNACAIINERPAYWRAMKAAEKRWGVPVHVQLATIHQESRFVGNARTPHQFALGIIPMGRQSSAYGYSQALDATWAEYQQETGKSRAKRDRIEDATDFMGWYMHKTTTSLGISPYDTANQYLAYHEGRGGFARKSYTAKPWLMSVSAKVAARGEQYRTQLASCGR